MDKLEKIVLGLLVLAVFAAVFFAVQTFYVPSSENVLNGVRVSATKQQLSNVLSTEPILIEMSLFQGNDTRNTALTGVTAEIASTLARYNKRAFVYGSIDGNASVNCVAETNFCQGAVVLVRVGECNCLKVENEKILVEGTLDFFRDFEKVKVIKGVFGLAVAA